MYMYNYMYAYTYICGNEARTGTRGSREAVKLSKHASSHCARVQADRSGGEPRWSGPPRFLRDGERLGSV